MSISNVNGIFAAYQYANRTQKTAAGQTSFMEQLRNTAESNGATRVDGYTEYLKSKYGNVSIQSVGKDQASLDKAGKSMSGNDVVIAPNILEQMANDSEKAAYYEGKIDDFFNAIPMLNASFAAQGLVHEPGGVIVHEDGSVTYIGGCSDSPERFSQAKAEQEARREKRAEQRERQLEHSQEAAENRRLLMEQYDQKQMMAEALQKQLSDTSNLYIVNQSQAVAPSVSAYERAISTISSSAIQSI